METTIELSLKDLRIVMKYSDKSIYNLERTIQIGSGENILTMTPVRIKELKEELQVSELYKSKATEELETQISMFQTDRIERMELVEELRKENEGLVDMVTECVSKSLIRNQEIERLTQSNKELVEALRDKKQ